MSELMLSVSSPYLRRDFALGPDGFITRSFRSISPETELLTAPTQSEGTITLHGRLWRLGGDDDAAFRLAAHERIPLPNGGERLEVRFDAPPGPMTGVSATLLYEAPGDIPILLKSMRVENHARKAVRLDGLEIEQFHPSANGAMSLALDDDYVRDAQTINDRRARSPWIEEHHLYVNHMLATHPEPTRFAYPHELDRWLVFGARFDSFRAYEFVLPREETARGLAFRRATRSLWPWTREWRPSCAFAPASRVEEYYQGIEAAAEAGYESVVLAHGWIDGKLTSPMFTNYSDYILRPELFPNGWTDVRRLTDRAHDLGLHIAFYSIYVNTWREAGVPHADAANEWRLLWAEDDDSARWGVTLDPATDWGPFVNRKIEEAILLGGFDAWQLDGPYYGDACVAENRAYRPGGPNQALAWERQIEFYQRMLAHGFHGEAAQAFPAFAHGCNRVGTTGYNEGEFHTKSIRDQIFVNRRSAYHFTKLYRPEQAVTFIPVWPWDFGAKDKPKMLPIEEHTDEYNAYLAFCFGYGFEGRTYCKVPFDGPKSKAVVQRWVGFSKAHADIFKNGYLLHIREPDGERIDAALHAWDQGERAQAVLVAYNPGEAEQSDTLELPFDVLNLPGSGWRAVSETGVEVPVEDGCIRVTVPPFSATWYDLER